MRLAMMMAMQAAPISGPPVPPDLLPLRITPPTCREQAARTAGDDILVCGRTAASDRLPRLQGDRYEDKPVRATTTIGMVGVAAVAEQGTLPYGQSSPRAMLRLKLPF